MEFLRHFETQRLHLRAPSPEDSQAIFEAYAQDQDVCRYMTWLPHEKIVTLDLWLDEIIEKFGKSQVAYVLCPIEDPTKVIGMIDARIDGFKAEIGYVLSRKFWGCGLMTEALTGCIELLMARPEIHRISAVCDVDNVASSRVMEKSGMCFEGILRSFIIHPNISELPRDVRCYSKIKKREQDGAEQPATVVESKAE